MIESEHSPCLYTSSCLLLFLCSVAARLPPGVLLALPSVFPLLCSGRLSGGAYLLLTSKSSGILFLCLTLNSLTFLHTFGSIGLLFGQHIFLKSFSYSIMSHMAFFSFSSLYFTLPFFTFVLFLLFIFPFLPSFLSSLFFAQHIHGISESYLRMDSSPVSHCTWLHCALPLNLLLYLVQYAELLSHCEFSPKGFHFLLQSCPIALN